MMTRTRTFATLEVSGAAFDEIATALKDAGYSLALCDYGRKGAGIEMEGIVLVRKKEEPQS